MRVLPLVLGCLVVASAAVANDASYRKAAKEMLAVTHAESLSTAMSEQIVNMIEQQMRGASDSIPPAEMEKFEKELSKMIAHELRFETMQEEFIDVYIATFSEQALRDMVAFYKTPLGQKMLEKLPVVIQQSMEVGQKHAIAMAPQINAKVEAFMKKQKPKKGAGDGE